MIEKNSVEFKQGLVKMLAEVPDLTILLTTRPEEVFFKEIGNQND
jgi:hypothetical protein